MKNKITTPFAPTGLLGTGPAVKPVTMKPNLPEPMRRGFNAMSKRRAREIQTKGGMAVSRDRKHMARIGKIGGSA